jgi:hypothetical protein
MFAKRRGRFQSGIEHDRENQFRPTGRVRNGAECDAADIQQDHQHDQRRGDDETATADGAGNGWGNVSLA